MNILNIFRKREPEMGCRKIKDTDDLNAYGTKPVPAHIVAILDAQVSSGKSDPEGNAP